MKQHVLPLLILYTAIALTACSTASETPSPSRSPSLSPSPSPSSVPSPSPTLEPPSVKVTGKVTLQGRATHEGVTVTIGGLPPVSTESDGTYVIQGVPQGEYVMRADKASYLRAEGRVTISGPGNTKTLPSVTLLGGDLTEDGAINLFDLVMMCSVHAVKAPSASAVDLNADGELSLFDLVLVGRNYDQSGPLGLGTE